MMMMAAHHVVRPLIHYCTRSAQTHLRYSYPLIRHVILFRTAVGGRGGVQFMATRAGLAAYETSSSEREEENEWDEKKKSRNQKKREARRAVKWGMDLASFSTPQIKSILRLASPEPEVFEAIMLVKRLGRDVREGKRRQFNYIGRLLREAEPELMDGLIQATKDSDQRKFQAIVVRNLEALSTKDDKLEEVDSSDEDEDSDDISKIASRWFDGLIDKDVDISKEVYSLQDVDFDRQELRRLVRQLQTTRERQTDLEDNQKKVDKAIIVAERSLSGFLQDLAKQLPPTEDDEDDELEEVDSSDEDEDSDDISKIASRWFDGLVDTDVDISKEVYSLQDVDFDRQQLRRLVRQLQTTRERQTDLQDNQKKVDNAIIAAERSLSRFLRGLAKQESASSYGNISIK